VITMRLPFPLLLTALVALACQNRRTEGSLPVFGVVTDGQPMAAALTVRDSEGAEGPFALGATRSLIVEARLSYAPPGAHDLRLDVVSPEGTIYAQLPATVQVDESGAGTAVQEVQVGGTSIDLYRRAGTWTVRAALDGTDEPLATAEAKVTE
jgi:hypothetical protein